MSSEIAPADAEADSYAPQSDAETSDPASYALPPAQPTRIAAAISTLVCGVSLYAYALLNFWSSSWLGIHSRIPFQAYGFVVAALILTLVSLRTSLRIWSAHLKLGIGMLAFLASAAVGIGGGRFVSYTMRGTLNPPINLALTTGDRFPDFELPDQNGRLYQRPINATALIIIYRGDFCPFSRYELAELTTRSAEFRQRGIRMLAISADPAERSKMLAAFLHTDIPLLSDVRESLLGPLGLIQHHRNRVLDNALPAFFLLDRSGVVRWIFTSPYYREQPSADTLIEQAAAINR